jgi:hypothetical protein
MPILEEIVQHTRELVGRRRKRMPETALRERAAFHAPSLSLADALRGEELAVIAEIKRSSPSKGPIVNFTRTVAAHGGPVGGLVKMCVAGQSRGTAGWLCRVQHGREHGETVDVCGHERAGLEGSNRETAPQTVAGEREAAGRKPVHQRPEVGLEVALEFLRIPCVSRTSRPIAPASWC